MGKGRRRTARKKKWAGFGNCSEGMGFFLNVGGL